MKFGRILALSMAALFIAAPDTYAQDEDMGDLTTKKPAARKRTVEEENNDPARSGPIIGLGATFAIQNFDTIVDRDTTTGDPLGNTEMDVENSGGFNVHIGHRHNRWVATELQVERYQQFHGEAAATATNPGQDTGDVNGWAVGLNERFYPIGGRFQPFALMGINYLDMETTNARSSNRNKTDDGPALRFGVGLDVYATNKFLVVSDISYMLGLGEVDGYSLIAISLGIAYRP